MDSLGKKNGIFNAMALSFWGMFSGFDRPPKAS